VSYHEIRSVTKLGRFTVCACECVYVYIYIYIYVLDIPTNVHTYCVNIHEKNNGVTSLPSPVYPVVRHFVRVGYIRYQ
jgi:hypothetical protein